MKTGFGTDRSARMNSKNGPRKPSQTRGSDCVLNRLQEENCKLRVFVYLCDHSTLITPIFVGCELMPANITPVRHMWWINEQFQLVQKPSSGPKTKETVLIDNVTAVSPAPRVANKDKKTTILFVGTNKDGETAFESIVEVAVNIGKVVDDKLPSALQMGFGSLDAHEVEPAKWQGPVELERHEIC